MLINIPRLREAPAAFGLCRALLLTLLLSLLASCGPRGDGGPGTGASVTDVPDADGPALVLLVVVDQLRGDFMDVYGDRLADDGLGLLAGRGVHYVNAEYRHGITSTAPGHATLVTGAPPSVHGIVGNEWVDPITATRVYCVADDEHRILGEETELRDGVSPGNLQAQSIGDLLVEARGGAARVFGISLKDRGAILPAGRLGKAFWYSRRTGRFVTSDYYYRREPGWLTGFNDAGSVDAFRERRWNLLRDVSDYRYASRDDQPWERDYKGLGRVFPHELAATGDDYYSALRYTPFSDELTLDATLAMIDAEGIGQSGGTDILAISLSATDYIGHAFGPESLEAEDNLFRLDRVIAQLLAAVDQRVGLDRTLVVLTSDHGIESAPELQLRRGEDVGRVDVPGMIERVNAGVAAAFDLEFDAVIRFNNPALYLNAGALERAGVAVADIEREVARIAADEPGIALALPATDVLAEDSTDPLKQLARASLWPSRTGLVYLVQVPGWHLHAIPDLQAVMHGSPYRYDTHVPIVVSMPGIEPRVIDRSVGVEQIAPSIAALLGLPPLAQATGEALPELRRPAPR